MSRKSIREYLLDKRRVYRDASRTKRPRILTEVCGTTGYSRKYVIKLLAGAVRYRERKGRGKTYGGKPSKCSRPYGAKRAARARPTSRPTSPDRKSVV